LKKLVFSVARPVSHPFLLLSNVFNHYQSSVRKREKTLTERETREIASYSIKRLEREVRFYVDLPGVLDPDLDVEIVEKQIIVRAQRTLPEFRMILCTIPLPVPVSEEDLRFCFESGVLEVVLAEPGGLK
jgi:HSP20 family molecular chaperone IbpA